MSQLRIIFMGTPEFAVASLKALVDRGYTIVGVITAPDRHAGRGRKIRQSAVKEYALSQNLKVLQPTNLKSPEFIEDLKSLKADLQIVVAFRMLPEVVFAMPKLGTFNLHGSLLPEYRGAAPINWAIINGENQTGVTTFFINKNIDTGSIILQKEIDIGATESAGVLHDRLMELGSNLVHTTVQLIEKGNFKTVIQTDEDTKPAPKLDKLNCKIDWNETLLNIHNKIRGLSPYPGAWTTLINKEDKIELKLYKSEMIEEAHNFSPGSLLHSKKELKIAVKNGFINILELKMAGKRKMDAVSLLNGFTFHEESSVV